MTMRAHSTAHSAERTSRNLVADLLRTAAYPGPQPEHVELRETPISWVFLTEGDVYKIKKPVQFAFLDFSTLDARRRACEAELLLNTRLATGAYFGLVPVRRGADGHLHFGPEGEVVDWAVHMLRLPDAFRGDVRLSAGTFLPAHIDALAVMLADFHARARCDAATSDWGTLDAIGRNVRENFAEVDPAKERLLTIAQAYEVERWQHGFLHDRARAFDRRRLAGRIREGHGDLRLEHFFVGDEGELTIIDCIELGDRFRSADVCADIAFLSMDLAAKGHVELAERFLARYARAADDYDLYSVVDFYEGYRAYVRGKVSALAARQSTGALRALALADARRHFALSLSSGRRSLLAPMVVAVGGVIASGKSTIADAIGDRLSAPVIEPAMTDRVYAEMMMRASTVLESGRPVVLDAAFRSEPLRRAARDLASEHGVTFAFVECRAQPEVCRERLRERDRETTASDGRLAIFDALRAGVDPATELSPTERFVIDTDRPLAETMAALDEHLRMWPRGLTS